MRWAIGRLRFEGSSREHEARSSCSFRYGRCINYEGEKDVILLNNNPKSCFICQKNFYADISKLLRTCGDSCQEEYLKALKVLDKLREQQSKQKCMVRKVDKGSPVKVDTDGYAICVGCESKYIPSCSAHKYCHQACKKAHRNKLEKEHAARLMESLPSRAKGSFVIFARDKFTCVYCGSCTLVDDVKLHLDHIIPFSLGGQSTAENLATACASCNMAKGPGRLYFLKAVQAAIKRRNNTHKIPHGLLIRVEDRC